MQLQQYVVDAFTRDVFAGNPAAVCILERPIADSLMQKIAMENNLSETAFAVNTGEHYHLRWFTPAGEINLCGHATLATSFVILNFIEPHRNEVSYTTLSGILRVKKAEDGCLYMDFPTLKMQPWECTEWVEKAIGVVPRETYLGEDLVCVLESEDEVRAVRPNLQIIADKLPGELLHITAPGSSCDAATRTFAPKDGIPEDPVCGRAHTFVIPYWSRRLNKNSLRCCQASARGGELLCENLGDRCSIGGYAVLFAKAELYLPDTAL